jgi:CheY-like chemotaxis protein
MARVLLMDDDEGVLEVTSEILRVFGYEVDVAHDGKEALEMYHESIISGQRFDLVIMDLTIPGGMGGKEAVNELHRIDPKAKAVISSGHADDPAVAQFRDHGFVGVIPKPYRIDELDDRIKKAIKT